MLNSSPAPSRASCRPAPLTTPRTGWSPSRRPAHECSAGCRLYADDRRPVPARVQLLEEGWGDAGHVPAWPLRRFGMAGCSARPCSRRTLLSFWKCRPIAGPPSASPWPACGNAPSSSQTRDVILAITILIWPSLPTPNPPIRRHPAQALATSFAGRLGHAIEPIIARWDTIGNRRGRHQLVRRPRSLCRTMSVIYSVQDGEKNAPALRDAMLAEKHPDGAPCTPRWLFELLVFYVLACNASHRRRRPARD